MAKLDDKEILAAIDTQSREAYGYLAGTLTEERERALKYYLGEPYGNEVEGRSQVVTRDTLETVEWILPSLLKVFMSGDKIVEFEPKGPEDVKGASQETDVVNYNVLQKNDAFMTLYTWFKDALLGKTGYVKVYWDESEDTTTETYQHLSPEELTFILQDPDVEIIEQDVDEIGYTVKLKRVSRIGSLCIDPVPNEEMIIGTNTKTVSLRTADYVEHRTRKSISDIRKMGYDIPDDINDSDDREADILEQTRDIYDEQRWIDVDNADPSMRLVWFRDITMRIDEDGDGIAELRRYYVIGDEIIDRYDAESVDFAALGTIPMPHRHIGLSLADLVMDIQLIRSTILRQYIDNLFLQNNGRYAISDKVNLDDMLVSRPGGLVRVMGMPGEGHIMPLLHPQTGQAAIQGMEYLDGQKESRTGITKYNQGLDANSLNKTATGISQIIGQAQQRIELIARIFAETGVKDLFMLCHEKLRKHSNKVQVVQLRNEWVPVDPRQWVKRTDMTISVGLGTGNKDQQLAHLTSILQVQREAIQIGVATPQNIYNAAKRLAENAGFKSGDEFFTDPSGQPQKPDKPNPLAEAEQVKAQAQMQMQAAKMQAEQQADYAKLQYQMNLDQMKMAHDAQMKQMGYEFDKWKAQLEQETKLLIAQVNADKQAMAAAVAQNQFVQDINQ